MKSNIDFIVDEILKKSLFYQQKFSGLKYSNFYEIPLTIKSELLIDQKIHPPFGSNLCVPKEKIRRIHKTSGTTNTPLFLTLSDRDIENTVKVGAKCFELSGLKKSDIVVHCLNYNMWAGGYTDHQSLEATGSAVIPFGVGNTHSLIETILSIKPTAIHCTPSYLNKIELILKNAFKLKPYSLNLTLGLFGAESGLQNQDFRRKIENDWGLKAMNANYGLSDVLSMFGAECKYQKGLHFMGNGVIYPELIDRKTNLNLDISRDSIGELVLTNLLKESQPLIRYRTNDIIKVLSTSTCECGQNGFRFEIVGRSDDMLVIKGLNVFLTAIDSIIHKHLSELTGIFQVLVNKNDPIEDFKIKIETKKEIRNFIKLKKTLIIDFQENINITPDIIVCAEGSLPRFDGKTKKILRIL